MDGQHHAAESAEGQFRNPGNGGFKDDGESAQLQGQDTAQNGGQDDFHPSRRRCPHTGEQPAAQNWPPENIVPHKAAIERHVPAVRPQRQQTSVSEEQALNRQNHHHGQKARLGSQQGREEHPAAQVPGGARSRDGVVDHLPREDQGGSHRHGGQLPGTIVLAQGLDGNTDGRAGDCVHGSRRSGGHQNIGHMHRGTSFLRSWYQYSTGILAIQAPMGVIGCIKIWKAPPDLNKS